MSVLSIRGSFGLYLVKEVPSSTPPTWERLSEGTFAHENSKNCKVSAQQNQLDSDELMIMRGDNNDYDYFRTLHRSLCSVRAVTSWLGAPVRR